MKILNAKYFYGKHCILTPFKGTDNHFSITCLVCATELTQYTICWSLNYFEESMSEYNNIHSVYNTSS